MDRIQLRAGNVYVDLPHTLTIDERNDYLTFLDSVLARPPIDKKQLLSNIPLTSLPSSAPLSILSTLLAAFPTEWPVFDLYCCYARLWNHLPEPAKSGKSAADADLLRLVARQVQAVYTDLLSLFTDSTLPAIKDCASPSHLSHGGLLSFVQDFRMPLSNISSDSQKPIVALALPNGPLLGLAILATTTYFTAAPLSVSSGVEQFRSDVLLSGASVILVTKLDIKRLGLQEDWVREASIQVLILESNPDMTFSMYAIESAKPTRIADTCEAVAPNGPNDTALLLFTSGTSGTKKKVPLTINTMVSGVAFVIESWGLSDTDICLNMMPLFHV